MYCRAIKTGRAAAEVNAAAVRPPSAFAVARLGRAFHPAHLIDLIVAVATQP
jgi:hypothetical protein